MAIHDAGDDGDHAFLVMERLPGATLRDRLADGPLSDDEARGVLLDVLAALSVAHAAGIVHRDIKPANVLATAGGGWKVADFGIAKAVDVDTGDLTVAGQLVGTPRFTAPERFAGQPATVASDVYSAGVVLREAVAGRTDVGADLAAVVARATDPDPARRFASADSMAGTLAADGGGPTRPLALPPAGSGEGLGPGLADGPTMVAGPEPTAVLAAPSRPVVTRRALAGIALAAALVLGGGLAWAAASGDDGPDPSSSTTTTVEATTSSAPTAAAPTSTSGPTEPSVAAVTEAPAPSPAAPTTPAAGPGEKGKGKDKAKPPKGGG